jgi:single-strand DNA-binding protein
MKTITIAGNIGRDAVTRKTQNGDSVTGWTVAVEDRQGQDKRTIWFDCALWGTRGEKLAQYLTKGGKVAVAGELSTREHEGKTYLTIRADQITLMGGGQDRQEQRQEQAPAQRNALDDEIPFTPEWR